MFECFGHTNQEKGRKSNLRIDLRNSYLLLHCPLPDLDYQCIVCEDPISTSFYFQEIAALKIRHRNRILKL